MDSYSERINKIRKQRDDEIIRRLDSGQTMKQVAIDLKISLNTVHIVCCKNGRVKDREPKANEN